MRYTTWNNMAAEVSSLMKLRDRLQANDDSLDALVSLNAILENSSSNTDVLQVASVVNPRLLFRYLSPPEQEESGDEELNAACSVLAKMLYAFPLPELKRIAPQIEVGLQHGHESVRALCLKLLHQKITQSAQYHELVLNPTMFHLVTQLVGDESLECSQTSGKIIVHLLKQPECQSVVLGTLKSGFLLDIEDLMASEDTVRFRAYDLIVLLAGVSHETFGFVQTAGFVDRLIGELESNDPLLKLNCLELLLSLAESPHGLEVVTSADVLKKLHNLLSSMNDDPLASILIPGTIKFFGRYCHKATIDPQSICKQYPNFLQTILPAVTMPEDDTIWGVAVDTLALFGSTPRGREALALYSEETLAAIKTLGGYIAQSRSELRVRSLKALSLILSCDEGDESPSVSYSWCSMAVPGFVGVVMAIARQPFPDLRYAGLSFFLSIARRGWGQREMGASPGFIEYLLDRKTEMDKRGKEMKYDIIRTLAESPDCEAVLGGPVYLKLKEYVSEGPFYVRTETVSVAFEDES